MKKEIKHPRGVVTREPWLQDAIPLIVDPPVPGPIKTELDCPSPGKKRLTYANGSVVIIAYIPHERLTR